MDTKEGQQEKEEEMFVVSQTIQDLKDWPEVKTGYISLLWFLFFVVLFCIILGLQKNISQTFLIHQALKDVVVGEESFLSVSTPDDFWNFLLGSDGSEGLLDRVFRNEWYNGQPFTSEEDGFILDYNRLVGGVLLLQRRSGNGDCSGLGQYEQFYPVCWVSDNITETTFGPGGLGFEYTPSRGGFSRVLSVANGKDRNKEATRYLMQNLWLDKETREVEIKFSVYNGHVKAFTFVKAKVMYLEGGIFAHNIVEVQTVKMEPYSVTNDFIQLTLEIIFVFIVGFNVGSEMLDLYWTVRQGGWGAYFGSLGNYLDIGNLVLFTMGIVLRTVLVFEVYSHAFEVPTNEYQQFLEDAASRQQSQTIVNSFNIMFCLLRLFKYYQFQNRLNILTRTFAQAWEDLYHFVMMFGVIFVGFGFLGNILFGQHLIEYSSLNNCLQTLWETLLGNFSYHRMSRVNPVMSAVFFWSYAFFVTIVLINVLLAILIDAYSKAMEENSNPRSVAYEMGQMVTRGFNNLRSKSLGLDRVSEARVMKELEYFDANSRPFIYLDDLKSRMNLSDEQMGALSARAATFAKVKPGDIEQWEKEHGLEFDRSPWSGGGKKGRNYA